MVYITPFAMIIVAVQVFNFDAARWRTRRATARQAVGSLCRYVTIRCCGPGIFSAAIFSFLLSWRRFLPDLFAGRRDAHAADLRLLGIATGSSPPLYPAMATVVFILASCW